MKRENFQQMLKIAAFILPFYLVFYGPANDNPENSFATSLRKFTLAGFCFYGLLMVIFLAVKRGII